MLSISYSACHLHGRLQVKLLKLTSFGDKAMIDRQFLEPKVRQQAGVGRKILDSYRKRFSCPVSEKK